jgi:thiol-disulfide isomerase/thioredoxin
MSSYESPIVRTEASTLKQAATNFTVRDVDSGITYSLTDFRGTIVVLDLFATWCPPCQVSLPYLRQLHTQYSYSEVRIISVDVDGSESQSVVSAFRQEESMDWIVSLDEGNLINAAYGTGNIPTFYIIDQDGDIQWTDSGFSNEETKPAMANTISYLLEEGPGPINPGGSDIGRILIIIAEVLGGLGIVVAAIFGYTKLKKRMTYKKCSSCGTASTSKCAKCGTYTCANCSTKGCKNCGSRQFIRL